MDWKRFEWGNILFILGYHAALFVLLPIYLILYGLPTSLFVWGIILSVIAITAITAGYHRLYSHQTYKVHPVMDIYMLFFGTLATQGSVLKWSADHRKHHAFIDSEKDPYSITKGFMYAHILWMFEKQTPPDLKLVSDLVKKRGMLFQDRYYPLLMFAVNIATVLLFGALFNNYFGALVFVGLLRLFIVHHCTWFINSLAHTWGSQNYSKEHTAVDNYLLSIFTLGEGYHNYHHTFAQDYRNGIKWYHFDPTKWMIYLLERVGLASGLRRANEEVIFRRLIEENKRELKEKLLACWSDQKELFLERLDETSAALQKRMLELQQKIHDYKTLKREQGRSVAAKMKDDLANIKLRLNEEWEAWDNLVDEVHLLLKKRSVAPAT